MARTKRETFYEILGVTKESTSETIEAIYLKELEFWEHLQEAGIGEAKDKILELTRAYLTLSEPKKRRSMIPNWISNLFSWMEKQKIQIWKKPMIITG